MYSGQVDARHSRLLINFLPNRVLHCLEVLPFYFFVLVVSSWSGIRSAKLTSCLKPFSKVSWGIAQPDRFVIIPWVAGAMGS